MELVEIFGWPASHTYSPRKHWNTVHYNTVEKPVICGLNIIIVKNTIIVGHVKSFSQKLIGGVHFIKYFEMNFFGFRGNWKDHINGTPFLNWFGVKFCFCISVRLYRPYTMNYYILYIIYYTIGYNN